MLLSNTCMHVLTKLVASKLVRVGSYWYRYRVHMANTLGLLLANCLRPAEGSYRTYINVLVLDSILVDTDDACERELY